MAGPADRRALLHPLVEDEAQRQLAERVVLGGGPPRSERGVRGRRYVEGAFVLVPLLRMQDLLGRRRHAIPGRVDRGPAALLAAGVNEAQPLDVRGDERGAHEVRRIRAGRRVHDRAASR